MENITIEKLNQLLTSDSEECDYVFGKGDIDIFGVSVALSGDGLVAIVGAIYSSTVPYKAGKVYTYSRDSIYGNWKEVNQLSASDGRPFDRFGVSVALSSDGLVAIVGAIYSSSSKAYSAGKVYTYSRDTINDNWVEVNQLTASDGGAYDFFGSAVALSNDGLVAMVGADGSDNNGGKVYTYSRDTIKDNWVEVNQLVASDWDVFDNFGTSVALSSDGLVAIVGASHGDTKAKDAGKVYTYSRATINDEWIEVNQLTGGDGIPFSFFGTSVALSDNGLIAIVGNEGYFSPDRDANKVYTYSRPTINDEWKEVSNLTTDDGKFGDYFGSSVALNSNGLVVIVGGGNSCTSDTRVGEVYTYITHTDNEVKTYSKHISEIKSKPRVSRYTTMITSILKSILTYVK